MPSPFTSAALNHALHGGKVFIFAERAMAVLVRCLELTPGQSPCSSRREGAIFVLVELREEFLRPAWLTSFISRVVVVVAVDYLSAAQVLFLGKCRGMIGERGHS